jgi:hypothetical protein
MDRLIEGKPAGKAELEFETGDAGIALDNILVTNDPDFMPETVGNTPVEAPSTPVGLKIGQLVTGEKQGATHTEWRGYTLDQPYVKLAWEPSSAPQGVRYYNIHRSDDKEMVTTQSTLLGSTVETFFIDPGLKNGHQYYYCVVAVDNWDNRSGPSAALTVVVE